jgi:hypothetical protein
MLAIKKAASYPSLLYAIAIYFDIIFGSAIGENGFCKNSAICNDHCILKSSISKADIISILTIGHAIKDKAFSHLCQILYSKILLPFHI